ncbi:MAG TPA: hypothetical protein VGV86_17155 [Acidimicrobiales bacterium]|nr:hypothetical protein [Acidimicrobiales bacterium]
MSNPQQPELARSRKTPAQDQDAVAGVVEGQRAPGADAPRGPVPPENQPGHHPADEQDKPDLNAFAEKLGTMEPSERSDTPERQDGPPARSDSRRVRVGVGAGIAAVLAVVVAVVAGRRRRSRG